MGLVWVAVWARNNLAALEQAGPWAEEQGCKQ